MPIPRLRIDETVLIVVDVQERLMPTIVDRHRVIANSAILLRMANAMGIPYLVTEQYPRGLGRTVEQIAAAMADQSRRIENTRFSAMVELVQQQVDTWNRGTVLLAGVEAHVCVLQTALDVLASGRSCFVCSDAISASQHDQIGHAVRRMERAGAVTTGILSAIYELLGDAKHEAFGVCLELAKAVER
jgi:nicotinamidase-related amidase